MINLPIIYRFFRLIYRFSSISPMLNPSIIDRRFGLIHRSGYRGHDFESSDNRQMICGNRQITPHEHRTSGSPNHQLIVNRFPVIINPVAWNLSPIHHQNGEIYHLARRLAGVLFPESSDNRPSKSGNHPTGSGNLPIIYRQIPRIYRSGSGNRGVESSDNRQMIHGNRQIAPFFHRPSYWPNHLCSSGGAS